MKRAFNRSVRQGYVSFFVICLLALAAGGCGVLTTEPYHPVNYFDLVEPEPIPNADVNVVVTPFTTSGPFQSKMLYRTKPGEVYVDQYNQWIQPPYLILTRYLQKAFLNDADQTAHHYQLRGTMISFEIDLTNEEVILGVRYQIKSASGEETLLEKDARFKKPFSKNDPEEFAVAMSDLAGLLARDVKLSIEKAKNAPKPTAEAK